MMTSIQPLSYQIHPSSCWVTSVLNGLIYLYGNKRENTHHNRKMAFAYRMLHAVLTDDGVGEDTEGELVLAAIGKGMGLTIVTYKGEKVEAAIKKLHFRNQVAIWDVEENGHSILLLGKDDEGFFAFDPDWKNVKRLNKYGHCATGKKQPDWPYSDLFERPDLSNLWISKKNFFSIQPDCPEKYRLSAKKNRTLSVITRKN